MTPAAGSPPAGTKRLHDRVREIIETDPALCQMLQGLQEQNEHAADPAAMQEGAP